MTTEHNDNVTVPRELLRKVLVVLAEADSRNALDIWDVSDELRTALEQPAVEPSGYITSPITWKSERHHSEQLIKVTQHRQAMHGYVHPVYTAAPQAQPAVEPEKTNAKESNADLDFCSNAAINEQRRNMVGEVEVGQSLGNGQHQSTGNSEPQGAVAVITGFDEYGPFLGWHTHWANLPVGTKLYTAPQAQPIPLAATCHCACVVEDNKVVEFCKMHGTQQPRKAVKLSDSEVADVIRSTGYAPEAAKYHVVARAIEAAVLKKNGATE